MQHRSFSNGEAVDSVETQKSRIVLHEIEPEWWILAVGRFNIYAQLLPLTHHT
jgi:hypothetical protein